MNKRFIRVAVFCALTATAAPVFVGCSDDYDADIANLQDQINKINGVIGVSGDDMAAAIDQVVEQMQTRIDELSATLEGKVNVDELTASVDNLKGLIDQKADPSAIEAEATRLEGLIDEANKAAADASEEVRQNLEQQISELEQKQDEAQLALNEALNGKVSQDVLDKEAARLEELINDAKQIASGAVTPAQLDEKINTVMGEIEAAVEGKVTTAELEALRTSLNDAITAATNDMATNAAVQEKLDALDAELTEAIGKKMDISTFNSLKNQLTTAIGAKADTAFVNQEIRDLNAELESVKAGYATTAITDQLRADLTTVTNNLATAMTDLDVVEKLAGQQGQAIADLQSATSDLQTLRDNITALQSKDLDLSVYADFSELANRVQTLETKWGQSVRDSIEDNTNAIEEINRQINGYFDEQAGAEVKGIFDRLVELEGWKKDIVDVTLGKLDVSGLEEGKVADIAQILNDIEELQLIVKGEGEEGEENTLNFYNKTEIDNMFAELETKVTTLFIGQMVQSIVYVPFGNGAEGTDIDDYEYSTGNPTFESLILTRISETTPVEQAGTKKIAFRVSPAAAAADFADKYDLVLDGKKIRSGEALPISIKNGQGDPTTGIVTYDVELNATEVDKTSSSRTYIFCATLNPKAEEATQTEGETAEYKDKLTSLTSNYFTANFSNIRVKDIDLSYSKQPAKELTYKDFDGKSTVKAVIDFSESLTLVGRNASGSEVCSDLNGKFGDKFVAKFSENEGNNAYFKMVNDCELRPESDEGVASSVGQSTKISATFFYDGTELNQKKDFQTVTMVEAKYEINVDLTKDFTASTGAAATDTWTKAGRTFTLNNSYITEILDALDLGSDDFNALEGDAELLDGDIKIVKKASNGNITVTYAENTYLAAADDITLELQTKTAVKVVVKVSLPAMTKLPINSGSFGQTPGYWDNNNSNIATFNFDLGYEKVTIDNTELTLINNVGMKATMPNFFQNYASTLKTIYDNGGTLMWEWTDGKNTNGAALSGIITDENFEKDVLAEMGEEFDIANAIIPTVTIDDTYDATEIATKPTFKLVAEFPEATGLKPITYGGDKGYDFTVPGVVSEWKQEKNSFKFENLGQTLNLAEGSKWLIKTNVAKGCIWKDGEPYFYVAADMTSTEDIVDAPATTKSAFDPGNLFGFAEPEFAIKSILVNDKPIAPENYGDYVDGYNDSYVLKDYTLSISEKGKQNIAPGTKVVIVVSVTVNSRFEGAVPGTQEITVTATGLTQN